VQTEINARQALAAQCEISSERRHQGGQHVGDDVTITIKHTETGLTVVLPHALGARSTSAYKLASTQSNIS